MVLSSALLLLLACQTIKLDKGERARTEKETGVDKGGGDLKQIIKNIKKGREAILFLLLLFSMGRFLVCIYTYTYLFSQGEVFADRVETHRPVVGVLQAVHI